MAGERVDAYSRRLIERAERLSATALKVARFIDENRMTALTSSATALARLVGTSDATVVRSVQALGYEGLPSLKQTLAAIIDTPASPADNMRRSLADAGANGARAIADVLSTHRQALSRLQSAKTRADLLAAASKLGDARRIVAFGIGPSSHLAGYMSQQLTRIGRRSSVLDATGRALADQLMHLEDGDVVCMFAYGGPYAEATAVSGECRRLRVPIVLVTDEAGGRLARLAEILIIAPRSRSGRVSLHSSTLAVIEAIVMGLAAQSRSRTLEALDRLNGLRRACAPSK